MFEDSSNSYIKKHLSKDIFDILKKKKTKSGFTLYHAIKSGIENPDSSVGIYAGDKETYEEFFEIFNPVISDYHSFKLTNFHKSDFSVPELSDPDPEKRYIISTRIRVARNLEKLPFTTNISLKERREVEKKAVKAFELLDKDLSGNFFSFKTISDSQQRSFSQNHIGFTKGDRFQESAGINRDWPEARGIFISNNENFIVWINEEDHLRVISMQKDGDVSETFNRLSRGIAILEKKLKFAFDDHLGYLTACPSNLGTAMRASVHIRLPNLQKKKNLLADIAEKYNLQIRGTHGEKTEVKGGVFDISNRQRLGITEKECIKALHKGICAIINLETGGQAITRK